jgi:type I restriction enzyme S subunit
MKSNYKPIGDYIQLVDNRNTELKELPLIGVTVNKVFIPSVANTVGTNMKNYKLIKKNQFACSLMQVRRDGKIPVALMKDNEAIISQAYPVFKIIDTKKLIPEYLMMWMSRNEFDREACFYAVGGVRGSLEWEDFCAMQLPVPSPEKQKEIVKEYHTITDRIKLNESLNQKLEDTAQSIYKEWFVNLDSIEPIKLDEYIEFNPKHTIKKEQQTSYVEMADVQEDQMSLRNIIKRPFTSGSKFVNEDTLFARITPCLENGKTAYVNGLNKDEVAFGSTEFIVMRAKKGISSYWVYCLAREEEFRTYAISSMIGSSGRQRVHSDYLKEYKLSIDMNIMDKFHNRVKSIFSIIDLKANENKQLKQFKEVLLSKMATIED